MKIRSTLLALAAAVVAVPAAADAPKETIRVEYKDLDLASAAGREELELRLDRAVRTICGVDDARTGTRLPSTRSSRCLRDARIDLDKQFAGLIETRSKGG